MLFNIVCTTLFICASLGAALGGKPIPTRQAPPVAALLGSPRQNSKVTDDDEEDSENERSDGEDVVFIAIDKDNSPQKRASDENDKGKPEKADRQGPPAFPWQSSGGPATPNSAWVFLTLKMDDFRSYLEQAKTKNTIVQRSNEKNNKVLDVPALVDVVRNLTNDYDNYNFVSKLNKSLVKMGLPTCYDEPLKSSSFRCNPECLNVVLVVLVTVSVLCDRLF